MVQRSGLNSYSSGLVSVARSFTHDIELSSFVTSWLNSSFCTKTLFRHYCNSAHLINSLHKVKRVLLSTRSENTATYIKQLYACPGLTVLKQLYACPGLTVLFPMPCPSSDNSWRCRFTVPSHLRPHAFNHFIYMNASQTVAGGAFSFEKAWWFDGPIKLTGPILEMKCDSTWVSSPKIKVKCDSKYGLIELNVTLKRGLLWLLRLPHHNLNNLFKEPLSWTITIQEVYQYN
jgi:hypothetical protein